MKLVTRLFAIASLQISSVAMSAEPITYIELPTGLSQSLVQEADGRMATRIPMRAAPSSPALTELEVKIFDVQYRDGRSNTIASDFRAALQLSDEHHGDSLLVHTKASSQNLRPGAYTVVVHVAPKASADKAQAITLVLQRPAPTLSLGPTVVIRDRKDFLWLAFGKTEPGELHLHEDSRNADLTGIQLRVVPDQGQELSAEATLQLPAQPFSIKAGGELIEPIVTTDSFPLGTVKGRIEVRTPDLTNVSSLGYEVRTREHPALILLIALFGAVSGWGVRVGLQRRRELGLASIQASIAVEAINDAHRRIEDPTYGSKLDQIRATVEAAVAGGNPSEILQSATNAGEELKALQTGFDTERGTELKATRTVSDVLLKRWDLPGPIQTALENARARLDRVSTSLAQNNLSETKSRREALINTELVELMNKALEWRLYLARYFTALGEYPPPIAGPERENLHKTAAKLGENLPPTPTVTSTTEAAVDAELDAVHKLSFAAQDAVNHLGVTAKAFLAWAIRTVGPIQPAAQPDEQRLAQLTTSMTDATAGDLSAPSARLDEPRNRSRLICDAWLALLRKVTPGADLKEIGKLMEGGQWTEAITAATKPHAGGGTALDKSGQVMPATTASLERPPGQERPVHEAAPPERAPPLRVPIEGTAQERQRLQRQVARASFGQSMLVGLLFVVGVYYLHVDTWVGTPKEILSLLLLAFVTDLTADSVLKALKTS